jgi:hypothetical protein
MATTKLRTGNIDLSSNTTGLKIPKGTTAQRPAAADSTIGELRENTTTEKIEIYTGAKGWRALQQTGQDVGIVPTNNFDTLLYDGNGILREINGLNFQPDFVWLKCRDDARDPRLFDSIRGATKGIYPNLTNDEFTENSLTAFNTDGFTLDTAGNQNVDGEKYVAWNLKAGGTPTATNTAGGGNVPTLGSVMIDGVASTSAVAGNVEATKMSVNTNLEFSIVNFTTLSGATNEIPHGLSGKPDLIIFKNLSPSTSSGSGNWWTYTELIDGSYDYFTFNSNDAKSDASETAPTATTVYQYTSTAGRPSIMYSFKSKPGMSLLGTYTGTGSTTSPPPRIYTGFKPAWLMVKRSDSTGWWNIQDNKRNTDNPRINILASNSNSVELDSANYAIDFYDDGFQIANAHADWNAAAGKYLFMCFATNWDYTPPAAAGSTCAGPYTLHYLVVAGGGSGGIGSSCSRGGGGAGGLRTTWPAGGTGNSGGGCNSETAPTITPGDVYTITVGAGGSWGSWPYTGSSSSISGTAVSVSTTGGGQGANGFMNGYAGGSGGGSEGCYGTYGTGGSPVACEGYSGNWQGGGGAGGTSSYGGAGVYNDILSDTNATTAGVGYVSSGNVGYAGGGTPGGYSTAIAYGGGVAGGSGGWSGDADGAAKPYTGSGSAADTSQSTIQQGGHGVVILRVPTSCYSGTTTGSPDVFVEGTDTVIVFKSSGSYTA